jgi:hypothetical protein
MVRESTLPLTEFSLSFFSGFDLGVIGLTSHCNNPEQKAHCNKVNYITQRKKKKKDITQSKSVTQKRKAKKN